jgi:hypothetical protein
MLHIFTLQARKERLCIDSAYAKQRGAGAVPLRILRCQLHFDKIPFAQVRQIASHGAHGHRLMHLDICTPWEGEGYLSMVVRIDDDCAVGQVDLFDLGFDHGSYLLLAGLFCEVEKPVDPDTPRIALSIVCQVGKTKFLNASL